jgi:hypothetical protein
MADPPATGMERIDQLARLGNIVNLYGVPLLLVWFLARDAGWVPSPMKDILQTQAALTRTLEADVQNTSALYKSLMELSGERKRQNDIMKLSICREIKEEDLRRRCLEL